MLVKTISLKRILIPDVIMLKILDMLDKEIPSMEYELDIDEIEITISNPFDEKYYNEILDKLYEDAMKDFLDNKFNEEHKILCSKTIDFIDKLYFNNKVKIDTGVKTPVS